MLNSTIRFRVLYQSLNHKFHEVTILSHLSFGWFSLTSTFVSTHECCVLSDSLMQQITLGGIKLLCHFLPLYMKLFIIFRHGMLLQKSLKPIWVFLIVHHLFLSGRLYFSLLFLMFNNFTKMCFCIQISVLMFPRLDACFIY